MSSKSEVIFTSNPTQTIWDRLGLFATPTGARRLLLGQTNELPEDVLDTRARDLSYALRTAHDFFSADTGTSLTSSALSFYYGTLGLLEATLIACRGFDLVSVEESTRRGHGLRPITSCCAAFPHSELLYVTNGGFLVEYLRATEQNCEDIVVTKNYRTREDAESNGEEHKLFSFFDVISRIPDLATLFRETTGESPQFIKLGPWMMTTSGISVPVGLGGVYADLRDDEVSTFPEDHGALRVVHQDGHGQFWNCDFSAESYQEFSDWVERATYKSLMAPDAILLPLHGITDPLVMYFAALYCVSIWVRYRPSIWRRILEGDLSEYGPLIRLLVRGAHTVVPQRVLEKLTGSRLVFSSP